MIKELQTFLTGNVEELLLFKLNLAFHNQGKKKKCQVFILRFSFFQTTKKSASQNIFIEEWSIPMKYLPCMCTVNILICLFPTSLICVR